MRFNLVAATLGPLCSWKKHRPIQKHGKYANESTLTKYSHNLKQETTNLFDLLNKFVEVVCHRGC